MTAIRTGARNRLDDTDGHMEEKTTTTTMRRRREKTTGGQIWTTGITCIWKQWGKREEGERTQKWLTKKATVATENKKSQKITFGGEQLVSSCVRISHTTFFGVLNEESPNKEELKAKNVFMCEKK